MIPPQKVNPNYNSFQHKQGNYKFCAPSYSTAANLQGGPELKKHESEF